MKKKLNISFFEKDSKYGLLVQKYVKIHDWNMSLFSDIDEMISSFFNIEQDVLIFDVDDDLDAITEITNKVKKANSNIFILFIGNIICKRYVAYLQKPFALQELSDVIINRPVKSLKSQEIYQLGSLTFNAVTGIVMTEGKEKKLSTKEKKLLNLLCRNMNQIVERSVALETIWCCNDYFSTRSMDVYLSKLRKLFSNEPKVYIENVLRKGFILHVEE